LLFSLFHGTVGGNYQSKREFRFIEERIGGRNRVNGRTLVRWVGIGERRSCQSRIWRQDDLWRWLLQLSWIRGRSQKICGLESDSLLSSDIELAELINKVGDWLLLAIYRLLSIVSTLRLLLLLLLLELAIPSEARSKELRRPAGWMRRYGRIWGAVISLRLSWSVLPTLRLLRLGRVVH
jgi:hypothetical protein